MVEEDNRAAGTGGYVGSREGTRSDHLILKKQAAASGREPEDRRPGSLEADDAIRQDVDARPASERTAGPGAPGSGETVDGLDETEESIRHEAEDRLSGGNVERNGR